MPEPANSELYASLDISWGQFPEHTVGRVIEEYTWWVLVEVREDCSLVRMRWPFMHCHFFS